mmetsp:Transcript_30196/g.74387  ORF Transcript_30196/g.74387 Transcript_30196/m.74387 type:complete len:105 (-) Transcript_30196:11-325(-)
MLRFVLDRDDLRVVHLEVKLLGVDGHVVRAWILTGDCLVPARHVGESPPPPTQGRARLRERWSTPTFASAFNPFRRLRQCGTPGSAYSLHMYGYGLDIGANVIA